MAGSFSPPHCSADFQCRRANSSESYFSRCCQRDLEGYSQLHDGSLLDARKLCAFTVVCIHRLGQSIWLVALISSMLPSSASLFLKTSRNVCLAILPKKLSFSHSTQPLLQPNAVSHNIFLRGTVLSAQQATQLCIYRCSPKQAKTVSCHCSG